ncbi:hypothetical protein KIN20_015687 [Parelaphostrongylus tenuis]|uniref:Uncharacterized protein n=1 Tax=Parelaphostrongylus tenuis TaxID=148309 RepID=A0AAD5MIW0_PARTN|nr:hypothetical protein KIN20_015687 [Parelaphostrongylus tenuis]
MRSGQFSLGTAVPPSCPPSSGPTTAHNPLSVSNNTGSTWNYFSWGMLILQQISLPNVFFVLSLFLRYLMRYNCATLFMPATAGGQYYATYDARYGPQQHFCHAAPQMPFAHMSQFAADTAPLSVGHSSTVGTAIARDKPQRHGGTKYLRTVPSRPNLQTREAVKKKRQRQSGRAKSE